MKLLNFKVLRTYFELNQKFEYKNKKININPEFSRNFLAINDEVFRLTIAVKISEKDQNNNLPFFAEVILSADFNLKNWQSDDLNIIVKDSSTAIIFPYLRNVLSTITMNGNVPPYTLPIMNITKLFNNQEMQLK